MQNPVNKYGQEIQCKGLSDMDFKAGASSPQLQSVSGSRVTPPCKHYKILVS